MSAMPTYCLGVVVGLFYMSGVSATESNACAGYNKYAHDIFILLDGNVKEFIKPQGKTSKTTMVDADAREAMGVFVKDIDSIENFTSSTNEIALLKYRPGACEITSRCDLSSMEISLRLVVKDLRSIIKCTKNRCSVSELSAIMHFLTPTYDKLIAQFKSCKLD